MGKRLAVTSHVSRDFLQNAAYFNSLPKVVWEYVSNSLDNGKEGAPITVAVEISKEEKILTIADNGTGMSRSDLRRFFTMHGENIQRKKGKRVRGRFGTGKSAAYGIAKLLQIETRQDGKRNVLSLHVDDIKKASSGKPFYVNEMAVDEPTELEDGTIISVQEIMATRLDLEATISYVEKHLARYHLRASVIINGHNCKFKEPPAVEVTEIQAPQEITPHLGNPTLTIKVAPFSLDSDERGIDILSDGIWHETTLGEVEGREFSDRLFGEVDVPILETVDDDITPFDNTRNNLLNRANPRVVILIGWISQELEKVRQKLVQAERERKKTEQAKKLQDEAKRMANILNDDFKSLLMELEISRRISGKPKSKTDEELSETGSIFPGDGNQKSEWQEAGQPHGDGHKGKNPPSEGDFPREGPSLIPGKSYGTPKQASQSGNKKRSGIFTIEFANLTEDYPRSKYEREEHKILVNLDHPQVAFALKEGGGSLDSRHFLSIVYEVAAVEYAQAIPFERIQQGEQVDAADALFGVGDAIDRITRKFSSILLG